MAALELYADVRRLFYKEKTEFLFPVYAFLEVTLVSIVLYFFLNNELLKKKLAKIIIVFSFCCIATLFVNVFYLQEIALATTVMSVPILCWCFFVFYLLLEVDLTNKLPIVFVIYLFLMHGVAVIIHLFYTPIMSLSKEQIIYIFIIRVVVFILAKTIVLAYLTKILILKKKLSPNV